MKKTVTIDFNSTKGVNVYCYGQWKHYTSRKKAMNFFLEGMRCCEGCEQERYTTIYCALADGKRNVSDGVYRNPQAQAEVEAVLD